MTGEQRLDLDQPGPWIDVGACTGCGLCVRVCPTGALVLDRGRAVVARPEACNYSGYCEQVCPEMAIARPFEIVLVEPAGE